jgi:hypothetical protein
MMELIKTVMTIKRKRIKESRRSLVFLEVQMISHQKVKPNDPTEDEATNKRVANSSPSEISDKLLQQQKMKGVS